MTNIQPMNTVFIGGGNMARAIIGGLLQQGANSKSICVIEPQAQTAKLLENDFLIPTYAAVSDARQKIDTAHIIVLAIKPQDFKTAATELSKYLQAVAHGPVILSIAAGIQIADMSRWLEYSACIRAMPNTPALINQGITGLFAPACVSEQQRKYAQMIGSAVGKVIWVSDESQMDAVTALSGSGPAYVFAFLEALQAGGEKMGLAPEIARELANQTLMGATTLALQSSESPASLRQKVTSKGGTTAAALDVLDQRQWAAILQDALLAAQKRGAAMAKEFGQS
ncbi:MULTISPECIES: pyrroline-5-carboxylate reductase [unclassified Polynucleobacter]|uniref:pyrroline-5-carboxylate reductase n=1 Tax=unclassified Polynucleobacter TaxID=2640945 RepID=UPI0025734566|nr:MULTISPECIES: pyrroline-5-carboxylate reductase [unclassified Polynucleobacter]BEI43305.1 pyrroline-5-carboxylate reductase [Polynucleobacter sp. HIN10]BEI45081.1 pyrroline-5-carboxylate reductase [Polynucleobacter sp. HIN11]